MILLCWITMGLIGIILRGYTMKNGLNNILEVILGISLGPVTLLSAFLHFIAR